MKSKKYYRYRYGRRAHYRKRAINRKGNIIDSWGITPFFFEFGETGLWWRPDGFVPYRPNWFYRVLVMKQYNLLDKHNLGCSEWEDGYKFKGKPKRRYQEMRFYYLS